MIGYEDLPLEKDVIEELESLSIDYVFQPIYLADGKSVKPVAAEAVHGLCGESDKLSALYQLRRNVYRVFVRGVDYFCYHNIFRPRK